MTAPVKGPLRLDVGELRLRDVAIAWTTRCVVGGVVVVSAQALAHRYNVHDELLAVLKHVEDRIDEGEHIDMARVRAAIAKAEATS